MLNCFYEQQSLFVILNIIFTSIAIGTRKALAGRTGMDVVNLSHRGIAGIALHGIRQECLHVLSVDANIGSRLVDPEHGGRQVVIVDNPLHVKVLLQTQGHAAGSRVQIQYSRPTGGMTQGLPNILEVPVQSLLLSSLYFMG